MTDKWCEHDEAVALLDDARTALNSESRLYWRIDAFLAPDSATHRENERE